LSAVGYAVLEFDAQGLGNCLDWDVWGGNRTAQLDRARANLTTATVVQLIKRFHVHALLVNVLFERHYPLILSIGPPALTKEPDKHVRAAAKALQDMARPCGIRVFTYSKDELRDAFPGEKLRSIVQERLVDPIGSRDRRVLRAAGAALAAANEVRLERASTATGT
jgi:hypothetical protein